jgi:pyridoxamine 5'-phosphate oxidase
VARRRALARALRGQPVPRPRDWTGFRVEIDSIEFWTHRADRLHHRELFRRTGRGWRSTLLEP